MGVTNADNIEVQVELLEKLYIEVEKKVNLKETNYLENVACEIDNAVKPIIQEIEKECNKSDTIRNKYLYESLFSKKSFISYKTLETLYSQLNGEGLKPITYQSVPTWCTLSIYLGFFGWKGFINKMTIEDGINKFKKIKNDCSLDSIIQQIPSGPEKINKISVETRRLLLEFLKKNTEFIDEANEIIIEENIEKIDEGLCDFLSKLFEDLINTPKLKTELRGRIDILLGIEESKYEFDWPHRAILASALSLSLLKGWDIRKVIYLIKLAKNPEGDPLVTERSVIGIVLSLLKSFKTHPYSRDFKKTLDEVTLLNNDDEISAGIYETLDFFLKEWDKTKITEEESNSYKKIKFSSNHQYFEPVHSKSSFFSLKMDVDNQLIDKFFFHLNSSISFTHFEKKNLLYAINNLNENQNEQLIEIFEEEYNLNSDIEGEGIFDFFFLKYNRCLQEFRFLVYNFFVHEDNLDLIIKNSEDIVLRIFKKFPYHRYIKLLPLKIVLKNIPTTNDKIYVDLGNLIMDMNENRKALDFYQKAIDIEPRNISAWYNKGFLLKKMNKRTQAFKAFESALEIEPNNAYALYYLGILLIEMQRKKQALEYLKDSVCEYTENALAWYNIGILLQEMNKYDQALEAYEKAVKVDPQYASAFYNMGILLVDMNKKMQALKAFENTVKIQPQKVSALLNIGYLLQEMNKKELAHETYLKAIDIDPKNAKIWNNLGVLLEDMNKKEQAIHAYKKTVNLDPKRTDFIFNLGWIYFTIKQIPQAKEQFESIIQLNKRDKYAYMNIGHCNLILNNKKEAVMNYYKSLDLWKDSLSFFDGFDADFQYIELHGISKDEYTEIRKKLQKYCMNKKNKFLFSLRF